MHLMKRLLYLFLIFVIVSCSGESTYVPEEISDEELIITNVQTVDGTKLNFTELKTALNFTNLPSTVKNNEGANRFLESGYNTYLQYYLNTMEILFPNLSTSSFSFIDTDTVGIKYQYIVDLTSIYIIKLQIQLPDTVPLFKDLFAANILQNYRSGYIDVDIGMVSKLISQLANNPENEINNTGHLLINYRRYSSRLEVNYIFDASLENTLDVYIKAFGLLNNDKSGKIEWISISGETTEENCLSWDANGTVSSCL